MSNNSQHDAFQFEVRGFVRDLIAEQRWALKAELGVQVLELKRVKLCAMTPFFALSKGQGTQPLRFFVFVLFGHLLKPHSHLRAFHQFKSYTRPT